MAYELEFYSLSPVRTYSSTESPRFSGVTSVESIKTTAIRFIDDDDKLDQVGEDDTPARLLEELVITLGNDETHVIPAGTEIALSAATRVTFRFGPSKELYVQGLLIRDENGDWVPPVPVDQGGGLYIYTEAVTDSSPNFGKTVEWESDSRGTFTGRPYSNVPFKVAIPYQGEPDPETPPCFTLGTLIDTPDGARPVEALRAGDLVLTRDHGAQALVWTGRAELSGGALADAPNLRPIRIAAGALGPGCPARDLVVSPQHRMLLASRIALRLTGEAEVLVPACQLAGWPGIEVLPAENGVTYLHLMLARHEVIRAEGAWSESLYPGPEIRKRRSAMAREIASLFPDLLAADGPLPQPARPFLRGRKLRELTRRAQKNARDLVEALPG